MAVVDCSLRPMDQGLQMVGFIGRVVQFVRLAAVGTMNILVVNQQAVLNLGPLLNEFRRHTDYLLVPSLIK